ncbi:MAG: hypothetical protein JWM38_2756 [Sphingomonas bacterium]|nr:hypothetical protein [Sphingomonas bacterium]
MASLPLPRPSYDLDRAAEAWEARYTDLIAELRSSAQPRPTLFQSFFQAGFECSTHRRGHDRARIDVIASSRHDVHAADDYRLLAEHGITTARDGLRWHLIGQHRQAYDWSSLTPLLDAAGETGTQVIWDLLHYGWPDWLDVWDDAFPCRFADFAAAATERIAATPGPHFYVPVNEMSFLAWGGGDQGFMNPFAQGRGDALKHQLGRAASAAMAAVRAVDPGARFVHPEPVIHITPPRGAAPRVRADAERHARAQFDAWDMICGDHWPEVGGQPDYLDVVGVNYYSQNQWVHYGETIEIGDPLYKPLRYLLIDTYARYRRPIFIAETGIEGDRRPGWFAYVCDEVRAAMRCGVPIEGICLYPVLNHPGWDDDRNCPNGLLEFSAAPGPRPVYRPLADELARQQGLFADEFGIGA